MFSGIVETYESVTEVQPGPGVLTIRINKPSEYNDLKTGDSIAVDGICLTLEAFDEKHMAFTLAPETLRVTGWSAESVKNRVVNLERSLRLNDRIHGHLVTGHVDAVTTVLRADWEGESLNLTIAIPQILRPLIWPKGSVAINGVSLTINQVTADSFTAGLIPETLRRTNLKSLKAGDHLNLEADNMARGLLHFSRTQEVTT